MRTAAELERQMHDDMRLLSGYREVPPHLTYLVPQVYLRCLLQKPYWERSEIFDVTFLEAYDHVYVQGCQFCRNLLEKKEGRLMQVPAKPPMTSFEKVAWAIMILIVIGLIGSADPSVTLKVILKLLAGPAAITHS
jgi:hypothetical protein